MLQSLYFIGFMLSSQLVAIFLTALVATVNADHGCAHDEVQQHISIVHLPRPRGAVGSTALGPLRIAVISENLFDSSKYCPSAGVVRPAFTSTGATTTCTTNGVLTAAKRNTILSLVMPSVTAFFSNAFRVDAATVPLKVPQGICLPEMTIPSSATSSGISNADYAIIVTAAQTEGSTIAFAAFCALADSNDRPVIGFINFGPNALPDSSDLTVRVGIHEMMHALGFSYSYFTRYYPAGTIATATRRGGPVTVVTAPAVVTAAQTYFNCTTLTGPELEDEGGSGTALSHWKRRSQKDDIMAGIIGESLISTITLAMFEASGKYSVNYDVVERPTWGKNGGCGFFASTCNTTAGGLGAEFCLTGTYLCTFDLTGYGPCGTALYSADLPPYQQYFSNPRMGGSASLMSFCPITTAYSNAQCNNPNSDVNNSIIAEAFSTSSRCIVVSDRFVITGRTLTVDLPRRCMPVRCNAAGTMVSILIGSTWADCPADGREAVMSGTPFGYTGQFTCPAASAMCPSLASSSALNIVAVPLQAAAGLPSVTGAMLVAVGILLLTLC